MISKKIIIVSVLLFFAMIFILIGCTKTTTVVLNPGSEITTEMSFSKDIVPIFSKNCALAGCHVPGGKVPDLTEANAFQSLTVGNYVKAQDPDNSLLMLWLTGKKSPVMPLGSGPNPEINAKIYAWINQGAKNN